MTKPNRLPNTGHGHVYPRPDGVRARCGGPMICQECARDAAEKNAEWTSRNKQRGEISGPLMMAIVVMSFSTCALLQPKSEEPANAPSVKLESGKAG